MGCRVMHRENRFRNSSLNLTFNILAMLLSMGLSFWITPFITNSIGAEGYGFIPLTQQFVNYMTVITISITAISGRFFTMARIKGNTELAQDYFSSTLFATVVIAICLIIPFVISGIFIDKIINVPDEFLTDVRITHIIFIAVFLIMFITSAFNDGPFSENKLYYTSGIKIIQLLIKTTLIVSMCLFLVPKIWYVSLGTLFGAIVMMILTVLAFKKLVPEIKITMKPHTRLKEILLTGIWISISEVGAILFLQIDLLVSNWFLTLEATGEYAVLLQISALLRTFGGTIISIFLPVVITLYASKKHLEMKKYINNAVTYTGIALALPIGIICGLGGALLSLWINPSFVSYQGVLVVLTAHLAINLPVQVLFSIQTATAKLKVPAMVTLIMGALNFVLACVFAGVFKWGVMGIAIAGAVVLTCKNTLFTPLYVARITGQKWYAYLPGILKPLLATGLVGISCYIIQQTISIPNFFVFFLICICVGIAYLGFVWLFLINKNERKRAIGFIKNKLTKTS